MADTVQTNRRRPGRPKRFDPDRAIDEAVELFWKNGYRETTTRDLELRLGLSQSSIYNEFGSKRELYEAALDRYERDMQEQLVTPLAEARSDVLGAIKTMYEAVAGRVACDRRGCMLVNLMAEDAGRTTSMAHRTLEFRKGFRELLRERIETAVRTGEAVDGNIEARAEVLLTLILGLCVGARGGVGDAEYAAMLDGIGALIDSWRIAA